MKRLVLEAWVLLVYVDIVMRFDNFESLHRIVREAEVGPISSTEAISTATLSRSVDWACVLYFKRVLCLQRSAATTLLLKRYGRNAEMVIGAQLLPFKSHAWCEIEGRVINDRPYMRDLYQVLERC